MSADLNPSQLAAVEHDRGPILVLAGAGSGKTRVVTRRIARLIERGTPAWSIVAMTFTNKAAEEMRERVAHLTGPKAAKELRVTTFHSFGLDVLGAEAHAFGFRGGAFTIFDQADSLGAIREILRTVDAGRRFDVAAIQARISMAKNAFETPETWRPREHDEYDEIAHAVYPRYLAALRAFQAFDFDDLVTEAVHLFRRREDIRQKWQNKVRYLLVDEYQDTNASQLELVRVLAEGHHNVMVVGDDDQSIYAWRGADVNNILDFERHFPGARVVKLEENYRSRPPILHVANAVLAKSQARRHGKVLKPTLSGGSKVELVVCPDNDTEAAVVADEIQRALGADPQLRARDVAVLYRSNGQAEAIEIALRERGVPHRVLGGQKFYERKEVKDILAYLRVATRPDDELSVRRVINYPSRGIGETALERLGLFATARDLTLYQAVERAQAIDNLPAAAVEGCRAFCALVEQTRRELGQGRPSHQVALDLVERAGIRQDLMSASTSGEVFQRRWGNVETIVRSLRKRDEKAGTGIEKLAEYLRLLQLSIDAEEGAQLDQVTLSTMHGAKGLEYKLVFLPGLEEGLMPHSRTLVERATDVVSQDIEEERRLFYVAITRARERLVMLRSKTRASRGKPALRTPSRFLADIPPELVIEREITVKATPPPTVMAQGASSLLAAIESGAGGAPTRPRLPVRRR
ncbi:MAG TPA: UvrD-helicase domain-containing protein [Polyangiaceae bacterium]|nr:UvrD-helicase domain-containing protein [Polyangiaceae bacterium]